MKKVIFSILFGKMLLANIFSDNATNLMWQDDSMSTSVRLDWQGATTYCENLILAGFDDWHLPNRKDLLGITDKTKFHPAIKDGFSNILSDYYWTSSNGASDKRNSIAWDVNFYSGGSLTRSKLHIINVRCVRDNK